MSERLKNWLWYGFYGVILLVFFVVGGFTSLLVNNRNELTNEIEKAKKRGDLLTLAEVEKRYDKRVPNQRDYPYPFDDAPDEQYDIFSKNQPEKWDGFHEYVRGTKDLRSKYREWDEGTRRKKLDKLLSYTKQYRNEIDQLLSKTFPPPDVNVYRGPSITAITLLERRRLARFYGLLHLYAGDLEETLRALSWLYKNANHRLRAPSLFSFFWGLSFRSEGHEIVRELLRSDRVGPADLKKAKQRITDHPNLMDGYQRSLRIDLSLQFWWYHGILTEKESILKHVDEEPATLSIKTVTYPWQLKTLTLLLRNFRQGVSLIQKPYDRVKHKLETFRRETAASGYGGLLGGPSSTLESFQMALDTSYMSGLMTPQFSYETVNNVIAMNDLLLIALDVKRHLLEHGSLPSSIPSLIRRTDPYTGKPYKFIKRKHTLILYSVGTDLTDNGGREEIKNGDQEDLVVKIPY